MIGPPAKIKDELQQWESTVVTSLIVQAPAALLPAIVNVLS